MTTPPTASPMSPATLISETGPLSQPNSWLSGIRKTDAPFTIMPMLTASIMADTVTITQRYGDCSVVLLFILVTPISAGAPSSPRMTIHSGKSNSEDRPGAPTFSVD